jgi:ABC-type multidrug transport system ATPase subunit
VWGVARHTQHHNRKGLLRGPDPEENEKFAGPDYSVEELKDYTMGSHVRYLSGALGKHTRPKIIELLQLTVMQEHLPLLREITLDVFEGESVALLGSSEIDKNTLLACILGQIQPTKGKIRVLGEPLPPLSPALRRQIGVMPEQLDHKTHETVATYLQRFSSYYGFQLTNSQIALYCAHYQLPLSTQVAELSKLQMRILALALALVHDPRLALLVEPLTSLTESDQATMQGYLQRAQSEGRTLFCTFTPPLAEKHFTGYDLIVRLEQGKLLRQEL